MVFCTLESLVFLLKFLVLMFGKIFLQVPFLDICNTLLDPNLPLTLLDYEEFGNPRIQSQFESILSYSPYDNITRDACYPSMLITASFNDSRQIYICFLLSINVNLLPSLCMHS